MGGLFDNLVIDTRNCNKMRIIMPITYLDRQLYDRIIPPASAPSSGWSLVKDINALMKVRGYYAMDANEVFKQHAFLNPIGLKHYLTLYANDIQKGKELKCGYYEFDVKINPDRIDYFKGLIKDKNGSRANLEEGRFVWMWDRGPINIVWGKCAGTARPEFAHNPCTAIEIDKGVPFVRKNIYIVYNVILNKGPWIDDCCRGADWATCGYVLGKDRDRANSSLCQAVSLRTACDTTDKYKGNGVLSKICRKFGLIRTNYSSRGADNKAAIAKGCFAGELDKDFCADFMQTFYPQDRNTADETTKKYADVIANEARAPCARFSSKTGPSAGCRAWCLANPGACDSASMAYCKNGQKFLDDPYCNCILSKLADTGGNLAVCSDPKCVDGQAYVTGGQNEARKGGCNQINCTLLINAAAGENVDIYKNVIKQECGGRLLDTDNEIKRRFQAIDSQVEVLDLEIKNVRGLYEEGQEILDGMENNYILVDDGVVGSKTNAVEIELTKIKEAIGKMEAIVDTIEDRRADFSAQSRTDDPGKRAKLADALVAYVDTKMPVVFQDVSSISFGAEGNHQKIMKLENDLEILKANTVDDEEAKNKYRGKDGYDEEGNYVVDEDNEETSSKNKLRDRNGDSNYDPDDPFGLKSDPPGDVGGGPDDPLPKVAAPAISTDMIIMIMVIIFVFIFALIIGGGVLYYVLKKN